jgi:hypothetical protein
VIPLRNIAIPLIKREGIINLKRLKNKILFPYFSIRIVFFQGFIKAYRNHRVI